MYIYYIYILYLFIYIIFINKLQISWNTCFNILTQKLKSIKSEE